MRESRIRGGLIGRMVAAEQWPALAELCLAEDSARVPDSGGRWEITKQARPFFSECRSGCPGGVAGALGTVVAGSHRMSYARPAAAWSQREVGSIPTGPILMDALFGLSASA